MTKVTSVQKFIMQDVVDLPFTQVVCFGIS
jgi:hypothetical protein